MQLGSILESISLTFIINNKGPRILPCSTLLFKKPGYDIHFLIEQTAFYLIDILYILKQYLLIFYRKIHAQNLKIQNNHTCIRTFCHIACYEIKQLYSTYVSRKMASKTRLELSLEFSAQLDISSC